MPIDGKLTLTCDVDGCTTEVEVDGRKVPPGWREIAIGYVCPEHDIEMVPVPKKEPEA
jgi:hypothetical protein